MKIKVKTLEKGDHEVEAEEDASLLVFRRMLEEKVGIVGDRQRLIFQGRPLLDDERSLKEYGIQNGLTIHMVERPRNALPPGSHTDDTSHRRRYSSSDGSQLGSIRYEGTRANIINGGMTIVRGNLFDDPEAIVARVREILVTQTAELRNSTVTDVNLYQDSPRANDMTIQIAIRGSSIRTVYSGARDRIIRVHDAIYRNEKSLEILDKYFSQRVDASVQGNSDDNNADATDDELIELEDFILKLEEVAYIKRSECSASVAAPDEVTEGASRSDIDLLARSSSSSVSAGIPNYIIQHSNADDYASTINMLNDHQRVVNEHLMRWKTVLSSSKTYRPNSLSHYVLVVYQEQIRKILHRLGHVYHSLSDLNMVISDAPGTSFRRLQPTETGFEENSATEAILSLVFLSPSENQENTTTSQIGTGQTDQYQSSPMDTSSADFVNTTSNNVHRTPVNDHSTSRGHTDQQYEQWRQQTPNVVHSRGSRFLLFPNVSVMTPRFSGFRMPTSHRRAAAAGVTPNIGTPTVRPIVNIRPPDVTSVPTLVSNPTAASAPAPAAPVGNSVIRDYLLGSETDIETIFRRFIDAATNFNDGSGQQSTPNSSGVPANSAPSDSPGTNRPTQFFANVIPGAQIFGIVGEPQIVPTTQQGAQGFRGILGPRLAGQMIVRSNAPAGAETARRAFDAAIQAANAISTNVAGGTIHVHLDDRTNQAAQPRENVTWIRRAYANRETSNTTQTDAQPDMMIGPRFLHGWPIYTNDTHLPCQSAFQNPRPNIHNSPEYERVLFAAHQATRRLYSVSYRSPSVLDRLEPIIYRYRQYHESENNDNTHVLMNARGEAVFDNIDQFSTVVEIMIRRALSNMADSDGNIAREVNAIQGEYEQFNYSLTPMFHSSVRNVPVPVSGAVQLEAVPSEFEVGSSDDFDEENQVAAERQSFTYQTGDEVSPSTVSAEVNESAGDNNTGGNNENIGVMDMIRTLTNYLHSGQNVTVSQVLGDMGRQLDGLETGFIYVILSMAYEVFAITDLFQLFSGDFSCIDNNRQRLRNFLIQNIFNDSSHPSLEDIESAAQRVTLAEPELNRIISSTNIQRFANVEGVGRVDLIATTLRIDRSAIRSLFRTLLDTEEEEGLGTRLVHIFTSYVRRIVVIANLSLTGGSFDYENLIFQLASTADTNDRFLAHYMTETSLRHIRELLTRYPPFGIADMSDDLVVVTVVDLNDALSSGISEPPQSNEQVNGSGSVISVGKVDVIEETERKAEQIKPIDIPNVSQKKEKQSSGAEFEKALPLDWIPVVEEDIRRMRDIPPQPPLSEAYLNCRTYASTAAKEDDETNDDSTACCTSEKSVQKPRL